MKKLQILAVSLGVVLGGFVALASAASIVIDDFTQIITHSATVDCSIPGACAVPPTLGTSLQTGIPVVNTIGGSRQLDLSITNSGTQPDSLVANTAAQNLSLNLGAADNGIGSALYDANGGGLGADLLGPLGVGANTSNTYFQALVSFSDLNLQFQAEFSDGIDVATFQTNLGTGVSFVNQAFASFTNAAAVDFTAISSIRVTLTGPAAQDGTISFFEITNTPLGTPEPASLVLLLTGVVGLGGYGWYRRQGKSVA